MSLEITAIRNTFTLYFIQSDVEGKEDIDYNATVNEFLRHHLRLLIQMIMNSIGKIFRNANLQKNAMYHFVISLLCQLS